VWQKGRAIGVGRVGRCEAWGTLSHVGQAMDHAQGGHAWKQRAGTQAQFARIQKINDIDSHRASSLHAHGECRDNEGAEHVSRWWLSVRWSIVLVRCRHFGFGSPTDQICWNQLGAESTNQMELLGNPRSSI